MRRYLAALSLIASLLAAPAWAQTGAGSSTLHDQLVGTWEGSYECGDRYDARLEIFPLGRSVLRGTWEFGYAGQDRLGRFEFIATQKDGAGPFEARPTFWLEGNNLRSVDFTLDVEDNGSRIVGTLALRNCGPLQFDRVGPAAGATSTSLLALPVDIPTLSKDIEQQLIGDWVGRDCDGVGALALHFRQDGRLVKGLMALYPAEDGTDLPVAVLDFYVQESRDGTSLIRMNWRQNPTRYKLQRLPLTVTPDGTSLIAGSGECLVALGRIGDPVAAGDEAAKLAASQVAPPADAAAAVPDMPDIAGNWSGFVKPRGHMWEEVSITLTAPSPTRPGVAFDVDARLAYREQQLEAIFEDKDDFDLRGRDGEQVRGQVVSSIYEIFEAGPGRQFMRATVNEDPRSAIMRRHLPIAGLGGKYAEAESFNALCSNVIFPWVDALHGAREAARELKVEFNRALAGFDTDQAALREMFADETMVPLFGMGAGAMTTEQGDGLLSSLHDCMLNWRNMRTYNYVPGLFFDSDRFFRSYNELAMNFGKPESYRQTVSFADLQALLEDSQAAEQIAHAALANLEAELSPADMEARIEANVPVLERMRPAAIRQLLAPSVEAARLLFAAGDIENQAAREEHAAMSMNGIAIPDAVPPTHRQLVEDLAYGRLAGFTTASNSFFAGAAAAMLESCGLPADMASRMALFTFLRAGQDQASVGTEFATGELIDTLQSQFAGIGNFKLGYDMIGSIGCADPFLSALSDSLVASVMAAKSEPSGRDSLFARTCQLDRSASQCACIAEEGRSVVANIDELEYSRSLMERIIQGNPFVGLRIAGTCRVGNY